MRLRSLKAERGFEAVKKTNNNNGYNNGSVTSVGLRFYFMYLFFLFSVFFLVFWHVKGLALRPLSFELEPSTAGGKWPRMTFSF